MAKLIATLLVIIVKVMLYMIKIIYFFTHFISKIVEIVVTLAIFGCIGFLLKEFGSPWIFIVILGSAFWFICFIILLIWKPKTMNKLISDILK